MSCDMVPLRAESVRGQELMTSMLPIGWFVKILLSLAFHVNTLEILVLNHLCTSLGCGARSC
jgi:hypothetical protein